MEPLSILRDLCIASQLEDVVSHGDQISFGRHHTFPKALPTPWKRPVKNAGPYTLETLVHFVKNLDKGYTEYLRLPRAPGVIPIPYLERKVCLIFCGSCVFNAGFQAAKSTQLAWSWPGTGRLLSRAY